ncbi:hypothetical protein HHL23_06975 [Chryseobacterium sp. RP-3-3]|uniref:Uncharacterized protein n=1 Tax=Chryseobacterium antibioticum TaxID=2728847 RepID=A0A7Y0ALI6_9FLAO|nr:hypothetical protein [Chryseobacterium antibioticum]NML69535.1 hypothetical protein [Chryseobacterium antibioticum]
MLKFYSTFLTFVLLFTLSCKEEQKKSDEYTDLLLGIPQAQIDSIRKAEDSKQVFLKKASYEIDSANSVELMVPVSNYITEHSYSTSNIHLTDPQNVSETNNDFAGVSIQNDFTNNNSGEDVLIGKSDNPDIFPVSDIKKFNEPEKILHEDKNSLLYIDSFGHKKLYYRQYVPASKTYYLYVAEVPKYDSEKLQYASLFSIYNKAKHLLSFDKEAQPENLIWEKVKPSISEVELKNYSTYYNSLQKELKFFLKDNDSVEIKKDHFDLYLYRDKGHSQKAFDQTTAIADSNFSGLFEDLPFENRLRSGYFSGKYDREDTFTFIKKLSSTSILVSAKEDNGYINDNTGYFIISSIKTPKGQFYLISRTNRDGNDVTALMNDYFSKHLKI